jgi:nicotinamidase-related amidase
MSHQQKLCKQDSALVVVDVQDKLLPAIHQWQEVLDNTLKMILFAQALAVPILVTEQYPKGLGSTNGKITSLLTSYTAVEKTTFSCFGVDSFEAELTRMGAKTLVIVGIETHICVQQTALAALAKGYQVHIIADGVGSRSPQNKTLGLGRIQQAGGIISGVEMAGYEWLERADCPEFKMVLPLIK